MFMIFYWTSIYSMDIMILHIFWFLWCTAWSFLPIFQAQVVRRSVTNKKRQSVTTLNSKLCLLPSLKQKKVRPMKIGHSQEETDIYSNHPFFRCVCCLSFREGTTLKIFRCCFQVVYHWSRPPPPWSHQHGFSDQTFSKDDRCGKFTSILWEHKQYPCKQGSGAAFFFDFSVLCRWISRETPSSWWISTSVVAGLTRSSPRICTTAQFRGARPWLDFGWANLLIFFVSKIQCPVNSYFTCIFLSTQRPTKKYQSPPQKQRFNPQLCIHASVPWVPWLVVVYGEKNHTTFRRLNLCGIRRLRGWIVGTRGASGHGGWSERWD